jgi:5'-3' exoribonuclease 2
VDHFLDKSLNGSRYFITFIDDFSRKSWIYFLATKSQTFKKFKFFKELVEKNEGKNIKMLRTDWGGESIFNAFNAFCDF